MQICELYMTRSTTLDHKNIRILSKRILSMKTYIFTCHIIKKAFIEYTLCDFILHKDYFVSLSQDLREGPMLN